MKKIITCILLFLIAASFALPLIPTTQSQTESVKIISYSYYWDSYGFLDIVGEVQNQGPNVIDKILLTGIVTGDQSSQLNGYCQVWGNNILPNQKAPFYMEFYPQTQDGQNFAEAVSTVDLTVYTAQPIAQYQYQDLTITNRQSYIGTDPGTPATANNPGTGDLGVYWVTSTIQNTGTETAKNVTVAGTFYNSEGKVVAVGLSDYKNPPSIPASQSVTIKFGAFDQNQSIVSSDMKIASYSLLIQNIGPMKEGPAPIAVATPTPPPLTSTTPVPNDGTDINNDSTTPMWVYGAIATVGIIAVVATLLFVRRRNKPKPSFNLNQSKPKPKKPQRYR